MAEHPNAVRIRQTYAAFAAGDLPAVLERFAPDTVFHVGGNGPLTGDHKGREGVTTTIVHSLELTGGTQRYELRNVFADNDHAIVHVREIATRAADGVTLDAEEVHLIGFDADGLIADFWDIPADPDTHDDFFDGR
ncbi:MAG: nuclear transport factor 2 family protein [Actinobacteria bacterium]|nr:nuclear transport factor 2 family protein [Actinomycetota bacterium]